MGHHLHHQGISEQDQDILSDCLGHPIRQAILTLLRKKDVPIHLADLARDLAAKDIEKATTQDTRNTTDPKRLYMKLYHCHIPKLVDADLVSYNQEQRTVAVKAVPAH